LEWLKKSLEQAAPEGYVRLFLDEGQPLLELLPRLRSVAPELVDVILNVRTVQAESRALSLDGLPDPLSEQEIRVLKRILEGKSNTDIASELVISVGTVKWHVHNVLQKLGVGNRAQAIVRARELGM
jgi:LuxR family maltose regulon positive regulatory protein